MNRRNTPVFRGLKFRAQRRDWANQSSLFELRPTKRFFEMGSIIACSIKWKTNVLYLGCSINSTDLVSPGLNKDSVRVDAIEAGKSPPSAPICLWYKLVRIWLPVPRPVYPGKHPAGLSVRADAHIWSVTERTGGSEGGHMGIIRVTMSILSRLLGLFGPKNSSVAKSEP